MMALNSCSDEEAPKEEEKEVTSDDESISVAEAEERIREIVLLEDQELKSTLLVNSEEALASLQEIAPPAIAGTAKVGDFFIIFTETQVMYRPSADRVVQTVPVIKIDSGNEATTTSQG